MKTLIIIFLVFFLITNETTAVDWKQLDQESLDYLKSSERKKEFESKLNNIIREEN